MKGKPLTVYRFFTDSLLAEHNEIESPSQLVAVQTQLDWHITLTIVQASEATAYGYSSDFIISYSAQWMD